MEAEEQSAPVKVYSPAAGMIVVSALGSEKLDRVQVFTLDSTMVHSYQLPDKQRMILRVPSGIYIVKASTQSCAQAKGQKISVRYYILVFKYHLINLLYPHYLIPYYI